MTALQSPERQRGAAFIYVMLIFVAASVIIGGLLTTQHLELDRTSRFIEEEQAVQYALGAETYARQLLYDDMQGHNAADYNGEAWSGKQSPFTIADGNVEMHIEDLGGRFNINSLLASDPAAANYFKALCAGLGIPEKNVKDVLAEMERLKPAPLQSGQAPAPPTWMADASELADHHLPLSDYLTLSPYIMALPSGSYAININTAPDPVLLAYLGDASQLDAVHGAIKKNGYINSEQLPQFQNGNTSLQISSDAFHVRTDVRMNGHSLRLSSIIWRASDNEQAVMTIARKWGE